jgi:exonuclease III
MIAANDVTANDVVVQKITNLKIVSWNVNGIRSRIFTDKIASQLKKNTLIEIQETSPINILIKNHDPDIICLQETRCSIAISENFKIPGYKSYFNEAGRVPKNY